MSQVIENTTNKWSLLNSFFLLAAVLFLMFPVTSNAAEKANLMGEVKKAVLTELMHTVSENVEINGIRVLKGMDIINDKGDYVVNSVALNGYNGKNRVLLLLSLSDKNKKMDTRTMVVEAAYDVLMDVFITSKPLASGTALTEDDFYAVKQKSSRMPAGAVSNRKDIEGKFLKANIAQGVIIKSDYLNDRVSIKRGQKVTVLIEGDNVVVSTKGLLRSDAVVGGIARVLCDTSKKEVSGTLISSDTVRLKI
ncbi:MAG: flagellar basal body P-ring formation protein FlgA [Nitrospirae bacterium]|nr:flagellar basal body P-ring formation protein FlgA [Nitrospirota bacterium]